jgi:transcriptional regulator with XRE-family HTH domain
MVADLPKRLGNKIRVLRTRSGLSQARLAEKVDVSPEFMSRLERGLKSPALSTAERIAKTLGISISDLFAFDAPEPAGERNQLIDGLCHLLASEDLEKIRLVTNVARTIVKGT